MPSNCRRFSFDVAGGIIRLEQPLTGNAPGMRLRATLSDADGQVASAECAADLIAYRGQPYFVSEFGGIWWNPAVAAGEDSWGYGERPRTLEEFYDRFERLCAVLLDNPNMFGYCYTQLTDIYQEQNGIYKFDRAGKFDLARLRAAQQRAAAIEQRSDS